MKGTSSASDSFVQRIEALQKRFVSCAHEQFEETVSLTQSLFNCRNFNELIRLQAQYVHDFFERSVHQSNKLTQDVALIARDAVQPMQERVEKWMHLAQHGTKSNHK